MSQIPKKKVIRAEPPRGKAVRYLPGTDDDGQMIAEYCLYEDIRYGMIPSLLRRDARIEISCANISDSEVVAFFEPGHGYGQHRRSEDLVRVLEATGIELVRYGVRAFEIRDAGDGPLAITPIMSGTWGLAGEKLIQNIPATAPIDGAPFHIVLAATEFCVFASTQLSSKAASKMRREMRQLDFASSAVMKRFDPRVDFSRVKALSDLAMLKASAPVGWLPRPKPEGMIDHYFAFRTLKFRKFLSILRMDILNDINAVLRAVGERRGFEATVSIRGLRGAEDFQLAIDDLLAGRIGPGVIKDFW